MDAWTWVARYADGSSVAELDPSGDHGFADVDLERVRAFELQPLVEGRPAVAVLIDPGRDQQPIFFRRRASAWLLAGGDPATLLTCVGLRDGQNTTYVFFDDQGRIVITDNGDLV